MPMDYKKYVVSEIRIFLKTKHYFHTKKIKGTKRNTSLTNIFRDTITTSLPLLRLSQFKNFIYYSHTTLIKHVQ